MRLNNQSKAKPATVGGNAIGANTSGRIIRVTFISAFTNHQASGTPSNSDIPAAKSEVQIDNQIAVTDPLALRLGKNVYQGTFMTSARIGSKIKEIAI